ncbi:timeless protein-domain-containing protein [Microdochium bolleyi]|uniref:Topoisomerase 1-associated factor 1 n=1 Tax=Microdochium bolleyi TaxID=196109 RepID=A0A136J6J0_9PEZI|nr:timeless protein-domain-containing protein [Microdochium bolleyi]
MDESQDIVHPEVRAHVNSLVSALGGFSAIDDGRYVLGDSALEVLRDLKKWIRFYDEKTNRMDVARCLYDANVLEGDLLHIIASWSESATDNKFKSRAALACIEMLVPMTWPLDRDAETMTVNHHRHMPVLQLAQIQYKRAIINFDAAQILHTAVRVALPSMALPRTERTPRDEGIIKLVLLFLRNIAMIVPPPGVRYDGDESQISRSALLDAFSYQDILLTVLTLASNMGEDFNQECVIVMEIIFHLVKRVDVAKLFMEDKELSKTKATELANMMSKEAAMHRPYNRRAPTRHNRWGTMVWIDRGDGKMSTVSGQDALLDAATRQQKMDSAKVFRPPKRARKDEMEPRDLGPPVSLNTRARTQLRGFVEEFLDSGFNPLFHLVRKRMEEQREYILEYHYRQFFYLISWFLEAERVRKKATKPSQPTPENNDIRSYNLVASVLNQETFVALNRSMADALEAKRWHELSAAMRCFTQILLTVQDMSESGNEDDEEIADNILNRIFYEDETHDRIAQIARGYKDQDFEYLDASVELTHTYMRVLEAYSKQNTDMQIRSRRRVRKKKKAAKAAGADAEDDVAPDVEDDSENDAAHAERQTKERKFDFTRFAARFATQGVVDTFVSFTKYYHDLNELQLKRAHRYFYRVAFKQEMSVMLFRVDIIHLLYNMVKGPEPLDKTNSTYKEWEELVKQILRRCMRKIEDRPQLIIEMLFSKINATVHYLEFGHEKQTMSTAQTKPAAELEFKTASDRDKQIAVVVGTLLDKNLAHHIKWVKEQLTNALTEREAWEAADKAIASTETPAAADVVGEGAQPSESEPKKEAPFFSVKPEDDARRTAVFKNGHLRLLMKLVGMERLAPLADETPESAWIIPGSVATEHLQDSVDHISQAEFSPPTFENGLLAEHQLRRKTAPRKKAAFDDEDDGDVLPDNDDDLLFPAGGPTARKAADDAAGKKKTIRRRRRRDSNAEEPTEEELAEKARIRREKEKEKARRFKSDIYVHASDDESDDERWSAFYANEEAIRRRAGGNAAFGGAASKPLAAAVAATKTGDVTKGNKKKKRKAQTVLSDDEDENTDEGSSDDGEEEDAMHPSQTSNASSPKARRARRRKVLDDDDNDDEDEDMSSAAPSETDDTPLSSSGSGRAGSAGSDGGAKKRRKLMLQAAKAAMPAALSTTAEEEEDAARTAASGKTSGDGDVAMADDGDNDNDDEDEDAGPVVPNKRRARTRAGFLVDDSSDDE